jgi:formiminotetrahydrofolate cyclodeaminase
VLDKTTTIENFLEAAAAKQPTPGGGSVAALAGALAAAMGEMVLNYSVGKKGLEEHDAVLKSALGEFHRAREMMLGLVAEDQTAYEALREARKLPGAAGHRLSEIEEAAMICVQVPQAMAGTAVAMLELVDTLVEKVNRYLLSDLAVCAELAMATTRAALYNVRVNLPEVGDVQQCRMIEAMDRQLLDRATALIQRVIPKIWERVSKG